MTEITLNLTLEELKQIDKYVELNDETRPLFDKIKNAYPKPETLFDVIRNLGYSYDCCYEIVDAVEEFEKSKEPEKWDVVRESKKWCDENPEKSVEDYLKPQGPQGPVGPGPGPKGVIVGYEPTPKTPEFLKFELGRSLEQLIERWWCDVFVGPNEKWTMEECIADLCDRIHLWLPKEQNASGAQNAYVECSVEGFNDAIKKIKSKIHNKKET